MILHGTTHACAATDAMAEALVLQSLRDIGRKIESIIGVSKQNVVRDPGALITLHSRTAVDVSDYAAFQSKWAWGHLPILLVNHGCSCFTPAQAAAALDQYVRDMVHRHTAYNTAELRYRLVQVSQMLNERPLSM